MFVVGVIVDQATRFIPLLIITITHGLSNMRRILMPECPDAFCGHSSVEC
jgi:hypothetical protein